MNPADNPQARWGLSLKAVIEGVQNRHFTPQVLQNTIAARLDVEPKYVGIVIDEHLGRPFLRIEVAI